MWNNTFALTVTAGGAFGPNCKFSGAGLSQAFVGQEALFKIETYDRQGNKLSRGGAAFTGSISVQSSHHVVDFYDHDYGSYTAKYTPTAFGATSLVLRLTAAPLLFFIMLVYNFLSHDGCC